MPLYEYKCNKCGKKSEFLESHRSKAKRACVHCNSKDLQKQFSVFSPQITPGDSKRCHGCADQKCPHAGR